jgi:hypothetical protein
VGIQENPFRCSHRKAQNPITRSLWEALLQLRQKDQPRRLWIDALCIDQSDPVERGHQVAFMADIYQRAAQVIVWLGNGTKQSEIAIECIQNIARNVIVGADLQSHALAEDERYMDQDSRAVFDEAQQQTLAEFFKRSWFKRLWVWQEVHLAGDRAIALCGADSVRWSAVCNTFRWFCTRSTIKPLADAIDPLHYSMVYAGVKLHNTNAWNLLRPFECSDPRDRVYAAFGLSHYTAQELDITPDYTAAVQTVYTDAAKGYLSQTSDLDLLTYIGNPNMLVGLPSWVPDWSVQRSGIRFDMAYAGSGPMSEQFAIEGDVLVTKGKKVACVNAIEPFPDSDSDEDELDIFLKFVSSLLSKGLMQTGDGNVDRYTSILWADRFAATFVPPDANLTTRKETEDALRTVMRPLPEDRSMSDQEWRALLRASKLCKGRCFYTTDDGACGLAPRCAREGDFIVVMLGCRHAMTLRPLQNGHYRLIGPTWIEGFMTGEALRGPLPAEYEFVHQVSPEGYGYPAYRHRQSGNVQVEDPRLGELPVGWQRIGHEDEHIFTVFEHIETGEIIYSYDGDPRLQIDLLEAAGHKFDAFRIV